MIRQLYYYNPFKKPLRLRNLKMKQSEAAIIVYPCWAGFIYNADANGIW